MKNKITKENVESYVLEKINSDRGSEVSRKFNSGDKIIINFVIKKTSFLDKKLSYTPSLMQRFFHIKNDTEVIPVCQECGGEVRFIRSKNYLKTCSKKCAFGDVMKDKCKKTCLNIYGVESPLQNKKVKAKIIKSNLKKLGVKYPTQSKIVLDKRMKTCMKKYGVKNPMQNKNISNKAKETCIKKYGVDNPSKNPKIIEKINKILIEKYGEGYFKFLHFKLKDYVFPSSKIVKIQGYEHLTIDYLLSLNYKEDDIVVGRTEIEKFTGKIYYTHKNRQHRYFPDLYIISENKIVETKSEYTFNLHKKINIKKRDACLSKHLLFSFFIFEGYERVLKILN